MTLNVDVPNKSATIIKSFDASAHRTCTFRDRSIPVAKSAHTAQTPKSHFPSSTAQKESEQLRLHGYLYYENANDTRLVELTDKVVAQAIVDLKTESISAYEAGPLLIGVTQPTYALQTLVENAMWEQGIKVACAVDSKPHWDPTRCRSIPHTTIYTFY